jgi:hypothetical protein
MESGTRDEMTANNTCKIGLLKLRRCQVGRQRALTQAVRRGDRTARLARFAFLIRHRESVRVEVEVHGKVWGVKQGTLSRHAVSEYRSPKKAPDVECLTAHANAPTMVSNRRSDKIIT